MIQMCVKLITLLIFSSILAINIYADKEVNFIRVNFPPLWITSGTLQNKGIADEGEKLIKNELIEYSYNYLDVTVARAQVFMTKKSEEIYCAVPHGKGFFDNIIESKTWVTTSGHVLISNKKFIQRLKNNPRITNLKGQLILKKFLKQTNSVGLITKAQRYPILDPLLKPYYLSKKIKAVVSSNMLNLYKMVLYNRADYTFQYESTVKYLQQLNHDINFITIEELNNYKVPIVVGCNNSPASKGFIKKINKKIKKLRQIGLKKMKEFHSPITYKNIKDFVSIENE